MDGMGLVIIGHRSSKSTFGVNNVYTHWKLAKKEKEKRKTEGKGQPNPIIVAQ